MYNMSTKTFMFVFHWHCCGSANKSAYSVGLDVSCFHLGQEISGGELELILQVNLQQGVVVTNVILCTWGGQFAHPCNYSTYNTQRFLYKNTESHT